MGDLQSEVRADNTVALAITSQQKTKRARKGNETNASTASHSNTVSDTIDQVIQQARLSQTELPDQIGLITSWTKA